MEEEEDEDDGFMVVVEVVEGKDKDRL